MSYPYDIQSVLGQGTFGCAYGSLCNSKRPAETAPEHPVGDWVLKKTKVGGFNSSDIAIYYLALFYFGCWSPNVQIA